MAFLEEIFTEPVYGPNGEMGDKYVEPSAKMSHDVSGEKRDEHGRWTRDGAPVTERDRRRLEAEHQKAEAAKRVARTKLRAIHTRNQAQQARRNRAVEASADELNRVEAEVKAAVGEHWNKLSVKEKAAAISNEMAKRASAVIDTVPGGAEIRQKMSEINGALERRYGKKAARAIIASGATISWGAAGVGAATGTVIAIPSVVAMLPALAIAELHRQIVGGEQK